MSGPELLELGPDRTFGSRELQARADLNPWSKFRLQFLAKLDGDDVAFLSFDLLPGKDYLVLYELFVAAAQRGRGLGSALIELAETIARGRGLRQLVVLPRSLADGVSDDWLCGWYRRRGFQPWSEDPNLLSKVVSKVGS